MNLFDDFLPIAVEGAGPTAAEGFAAVVEPVEPDPDWHPL
ncbi:hypothetical protein HNQ86_002564 [Oleiagrimonas soli]|uniref:Uncharacterized protein n=1 Tax=Oleiagrimonas soli TaxID=1543381 RepID=A0A841KN06_9GAMM|nr:hypothetical protein [Oleiagrimonas soli]